MIIVKLWMKCNLVLRTYWFKVGDNSRRIVARNFSIGGLCVSVGGLWVCAVGLTF